MFVGTEFLATLDFKRNKIDLAMARALLRGEHTLIGDIIGDSFSDDPVNNWVFGGEQGMTAYYRLIANKLYLRRGFGHVIDDEAGPCG